MSRIGNFIISGRENCCGCGNCVLACPSDAIEMKSLELGCLYPVVDESRCSNCGLCTQVCIYQHRETDGAGPLKAYAAAARDETVLRRSASGGVFACAARKILLEGGTVFGCSMECGEVGLIPMHIPIERIEDVPKLQGSKYVQSDLGQTHVQIRKLLRDGKTVLFSGTPCQVDSLKRYLAGEDVTGLYTIDLVCHGVPSAKLFREYLSLMNKEMTAFLFRDKEKAWGLNGAYTYIDGGKSRSVRFSPGLSSYYSYFLESEIYRESCYSCPYANTHRVADLTIGDYWGIEEAHPEYLQEKAGLLSLKKGVSAVLVNTSKGQQLLEMCDSDLILLDTQIDKIVRGNKQLRAPSSHTQTRTKLLCLYAEQGYKGVEKYWRKSLGLRFHARHLKARFWANRALK